jgi:hypothetical protein
VSMDRYSILSHEPPTTKKANGGPSSGAAEPGHGASHPAQPSVSAGMAVANALLPEKPGQKRSEKSSLNNLGFPGEDGGRSLTAMAERDLDAALQLLAERAQYITGASGAAIALRRGAAHDMLCRASAGSNAPELGSLLSTEYGLSGESVRTRQALRCDDAERDSRVNRDGCRQLGIASVVIMPIVGEQEVIGVFELFSGKANAFNERDLAALERLGRMVETAVTHAVAAQSHPEAGGKLQIDIQPPAGKNQPKAVAASAAAAAAVGGAPATSAPAKEDHQAVTPKPLFWSAASAPQAPSRATSEPESLPIPPVMRQLQKCQACGFPVSSGRTFCVECENKKLGKQPPRPAPAGAAETPLTSTYPSKGAASVKSKSDHATAVAELPDDPDGSEESTSALRDHDVFANSSSEIATTDTAAPFLSSALPSESWFARNKFIAGAMLLIAIAIAAIAYLR